MGSYSTRHSKSVILLDLPIIHYEVLGESLTCMGLSIFVCNLGKTIFIVVAPCKAVFTSF